MIKLNKILNILIIGIIAISAISAVNAVDRTSLYKDEMNVKKLNNVDHSLIYKANTDARTIATAEWTRQIMRYTDLSQYYKPGVNHWTTVWGISSQQKGAKP
jgi:hypothetical protein